MAFRPQIKPYKVISNGDMSGNITGTPTIIDKLSMLSYEFDWSGASPVGTVSVQVSNTYSLNPYGSVDNPGMWSTVVLNYGGSAVTSIPISGNTGTGFVDIDATGAYAMRVIYTFTSGTGTLNVTLNAKVA
jgi:hypothetical protein